MYFYKVRDHRVIDGDTLELTLDLGFKLHHIIFARLTGIDAPEKNTTAGKAVKQWVQDLLGKSDNLTCKVLSPDKYGGRWICDVLVDGEIGLSSVLLSKNVVKKFTGKTKKEIWTTDELKAVECLLGQIDEIQRS